MATRSRRLALLYAPTAVVEQGCGLCRMVDSCAASSFDPCTFESRSRRSTAANTPFLVKLASNRRLHMHPLTLQMHNDCTCWRGEGKSANSHLNSNMLQQTCAWHHGLIQELRACLCALFTDALLMRQDGEAVVQPIVPFLPEVTGVTLLFRTLGMT